MATKAEFPSEERLAEFSEAFDQHGPGAELAQVGDGVGLSAADQETLLGEWQSISAGLQDLPTQKANLAEPVMAEIRRAGLVDQRQGARRSKGGRPQQNGQRLAKIIALATTSVAMLYVSIQIATHETSLNRSAEVLASFSFDPHGWDVVVVTVSDEQANQLSRDFGSGSVDSELKAMPLLENQQSEDGSFDVVMASKETSEELLGRLVSDPATSDAEWNPQRVGEWDRKELLERFASSMKTPTKSDIFFREVIVVTSEKDRGIQVTSQPVGASVGSETLANSMNPANDDPERPSEGRITVESETVLRQLQDHGRRPVLVVLKRRPVEDGDSQGNVGNSEPGYAVYL